MVTLEIIQQIAALEIADDDLVGRRDQAAACFLFASGMRAAAFGSMPIQSFDPEALTVRQLPSLGVRTKNAKSAVTSLLPIPAVIAVIRSWDQFVRASLPPTAAWFAPVQNDWGLKRLSPEPPGESRQHQLIKALRRIYARAGLPYYHPHVHRHGHATWGLSQAQSLSDNKAISQNLMHGDLFTTDRTYSLFTGEDVHRRIQALGATAPARPGSGSTTLDQLVDKLAPVLLEKLKQALQDAQW